MLNLLRTRRSIRKFKPEPLDTAKIELLKEAVLRSPSSRGLNPWEFIFVQDKDLRTRLAKVKQHGAEFVADAALVIVICADPEACDVWIEDCSIASFVAHLAAHSLGLGSCWVQIRLRKTADETDSEQAVRNILGIPDAIRVLSMVAIGPADRRPRAIPAEKLPASKIHADQW